ncbi:MAG: hypothetical protein FD129_3126 [bacterium]|nr:MAG: hypothetical protein FD129_3126 [bacterium]
MFPSPPNGGGYGPTIRILGFIKWVSETALQIVAERLRTETISIIAVGGRGGNGLPWSACESHSWPRHWRWVGRNGSRGRCRRLLREPGPEGERLAAQGVRVESGLGRWRFDPFTPGRLAARLSAHGIEAAWCLDHQNAVVNLALAARRAPALSRLFLAVHTTGLWGGGSSLPRGVRAVLPLYSKVVAVAAAQRKYLVVELGMPKEHVVVVRNGIDVGRFAATPERTARAAKLRRAWAETFPGPVLGVIAALRPEKGRSARRRATRLRW